MERRARGSGCTGAQGLERLLQSEFTGNLGKIGGVEKEEVSPGQVFLRSATWVIFRTPQVTLLRAALPDTYQKLSKRGTVAYAI